MCLCARTLGVWILNPLKTMYVLQKKSKKSLLIFYKSYVEEKSTKLPLLNLLPLRLGLTSSSYAFASGTLKSHLLVSYFNLLYKIDLYVPIK